jgi:hypothetical protein
MMFYYNSLSAAAHTMGLSRVPFLFNFLALPLLLFLTLFLLQGQGMLYPFQGELPVDLAPFEAFLFQPEADALAFSRTLLDSVLDVDTLFEEFLLQVLEVLAAGKVFDDGIIQPVPSPLRFIQILAMGKLQVLLQGWGKFVFPGQFLGNFLASKTEPTVVDGLPVIADPVGNNMQVSMVFIGMPGDDKLGVVQLESGQVFLGQLHHQPIVRIFPRREAKDAMENGLLHLGMELMLAFEILGH